MNYNTSKTPEHYTPDIIINAVLQVFDNKIDLDPASNSYTKPNVPARVNYTADMNGLKPDWFGNVYLNPPYGNKPIIDFCNKVQCEIDKKQMSQIIVLVKNDCSTRWYKSLTDCMNYKCEVNTRLKFKNPDNKNNAATFSSAVFYWGCYPDKFKKVFSQFGPVWSK